LLNALAKFYETKAHQWVTKQSLKSFCIGCMQVFGTQTKASALLFPLTGSCACIISSASIM